MNRRDFIRSSGAFVLTTGAGLGTGGCSSLIKTLVYNFLEIGKYDSDEIFIGPVDELLEGALLYNVEIIYQICKGYFLKLKSNDIGFVKGNKLLTVNHIFQDGYLCSEIDDELIPFKVIKIPLKVIEKYIYLPDGEELEIIYQDEHNDLAVAEVPDRIKPIFDLGNSDKLEEGNIIACVSKCDDENTIKMGRVVSTTCYDAKLCDKPEYHFMIRGEELKNGGSGGPGIAFSYGKPEIVGMVKSGYKCNGKFLGGIHKINHIKEVLSRYI